MLSLRRTTRAGPDSFLEHLEIDDDGRCSLWRSAGWATSPVTPVGRFERRLSDADLDRLRRSLSGVDGDAEVTPRPGAAVDEVEAGAGKARAFVPVRDLPDGPWRAVLEAVRPLFVEVAASPVAALELAVRDHEIVVRHVGTEPVRVSPSEAWVRAEAVDGNGSVTHEWPAVGLDALPEVIDPGWEATFPLAADGPRPDDRIRAFAALALLDGDAVRAVSLESPA